MSAYLSFKGMELKKSSKVPSTHSPLSRMMKKGQAKTGYKSTSGNLLMQMSENDHKRIATLIAHWLNEDNRKAN
jgi:hypothetical protein